MGVKKSFLSVRFFTKTAALNHGVILNQCTTFKASLDYRWIQLTDALPKLWKDRILNCTGNSMNLCIFDHHLIKKNNLYCLNKLRTRELCQIQISEKYKKPISQFHYERYFSKFNFDWKSIYLLPQMVTVDKKVRLFQNKILNNILFVNKMLFKFKKVESPLCSLCKAEDETYIPLFYRCRQSSILWRQLRQFFSAALDLPSISPQSVIFGFLDDTLEHKLLINNILLIFKNY